jgi:cysteine desulfuration protein SufE
VRHLDAPAVPGSARPATATAATPRQLDARGHPPHIPSMSDPFVQPQEATAAEAIAAISEELDVFDDWMERYQFIIELGRKLPAFPDAWTDDAHRVPGCQSKVWMEGTRRDDKLFLAGLSDAAIVSGLIALLLRVYSGRPPAEIVATEPGFLRDLGLLEALSTNRGNGIAAMARKIRELAALQTAA